MSRQQQNLTPTEQETDKTQNLRRCIQPATRMQRPVLQRHTIATSTKENKPPIHQIPAQSEISEIKNLPRIIQPKIRSQLPSKLTQKNVITTRNHKLTKPVISNQPETLNLRRSEKQPILIQRQSQQSYTFKPTTNYNKSSIPQMQTQPENKAQKYQQTIQPEIRMQQPQTQRHNTVKITRNSHLTRHLISNQPETTKTLNQSQIAKQAIRNPSKQNQTTKPITINKRSTTHQMPNQPEITKSQHPKRFVQQAIRIQRPSGQSYESETRSSSGKPPQSHLLSQLKYPESQTRPRTSKPEITSQPSKKNQKS